MNKNQTVGVVVGRFQTPNLHEGQRFLLDTATAATDALLIVVGVTDGIGKNNSLDFATRAVMLKNKYPEAKIVKIKDHLCDEAWSAQLDALIAEHFPLHEVILFGSRDSFLPFYHGIHRKNEVNSPIEMSATQLRQEVVDTGAVDCPNFRAGIIYASAKTYPTSFQTVDIVIRHSTEKKVLVGRKAGEKEWRLPGGFVDPNDDSLEAAAKREAQEEVGDIELADVKYICSVRIDDYRYRKSEHKIMTALHSAVYVFGRIVASDDLDEVRWQDEDGLVECLAPAHKPLGLKYLASLH